MVTCVRVFLLRSKTHNRVRCPTDSCGEDRCSGVREGLDDEVYLTSDTSSVVIHFSVYHRLYRICVGISAQG